VVIEGKSWRGKEHNANEKGNQTSIISKCPRKGTLVHQILYAGERIKKKKPKVHRGNEWEKGELHKGKRKKSEASILPPRPMKSRVKKRGI